MPDKTDMKESADITILLVEDDDQLRSAVAQVLSRRGYQVVKASNGKKAERAIREALPDLVVTDVLMPEVDGLELLIFLRDFAPSVPVIAMSAGGRMQAEFYHELAGRLGARHILAKPFRASDLLAAIHTVLWRSEKNAILAATGVGAAQELPNHAEANSSAFVTTRNP